MRNDIQSEILLESGTNELEIMEFTIAGEIFGINVAKVREIMKAAQVKPMQNAHPVVEGIFKPRGEVITVIDLAAYLHLPPAEDNSRDIFIITHFNELQFAFHVHSVEGIDRISWKNIQKPDRVIYGGDEGVATGIAQFENRLITILDFEKIVVELCPDTGLHSSQLDNLGHREPRKNKPVLVVEDSMLLSKLIIESLHRAGYTSTIKSDNGQEAWDFICSLKAKGENVREHVSVVVTDIEMPQMDGHHLLKCIKDDKELHKLPVVLFSSLISEPMRVKGDQLGADDQISKPEIGRLVEILDRLTDDEP